MSTDEHVRSSEAEAPGRLITILSSHSSLACLNTLCCLLFAHGVCNSQGLRDGDYALTARKNGAVSEREKRWLIHWPSPCMPWTELPSSPVSLSGTPTQRRALFSRSCGSACNLPRWMRGVCVRCHQDATKYTPASSSKS